MDNYLDQAAAYAAKQLDAVGFLDWLIPGALAEYRLREWLDTRAITFPGEPDRRCDTVAGLEHRNGQQPPEAIVIEFKDRARGLAALEQLAEYALRVHREVPVQPGLPDRYAVGCVLVNLTGRQEPSVLCLKARSLAGGELKFKPVIRNLEKMSAPGTLRSIANGRFSRCVLVWIPLMQRGEKAGTIEQWKELAVTEPDERKRSDYAALALIFAEATDHLAEWKHGLEGWNMKPSTVIQEWIQQGEARGAAVVRANIIYLLRQRFGTVPADLLAQIEAQSDLTQLDLWFKLAMNAGTLDQFRASLSSPVNGQ